MGVMLDWEQEYFTLHERNSEVVNKVFVRLFEDGLIYRANRMINWSCALETALSNLEVEVLEVKGPTKLKVPGYEEKQDFGWMTTFRYPLEESGFIEVATTRLETMLGDTAIAVNPTDERWSSLIGQHAVHPFSKRLLPIIADEYVSKELGTGAVKLTPAHDQNDFNLGQKHSLASIEIFTESGRIKNSTSDFNEML